MELKGWRTFIIVAAVKLIVLIIVIAIMIHSINELLPWIRGMMYG